MCISVRYFSKCTFEPISEFESNSVDLKREMTSMKTDECSLLGDCGELNIRQKKSQKGDLMKALPLAQPSVRFVPGFVSQTSLLS